MIVILVILAPLLVVLNVYIIKDFLDIKHFSMEKFSRLIRGLGLICIYILLLCIALDVQC